MYSITADPQFARRVAQEQIDRRVRDATERRTVRDVRRAGAMESTTTPARRGWRFATVRRAFA